MIVFRLNVLIRLPLSDVSRDLVTCYVFSGKALCIYASVKLRVHTDRQTDRQLVLPYERQVRRRHSLAVPCGYSTFRLLYQSALLQVRALEFLFTIRSHCRSAIVEA